MSLIDNLARHLPKQPINSSRFSWSSGIGVAELSDLRDIRIKFHEKEEFEVKSEKTGAIEKFRWARYETSEGELVSIDYESPSAKIKLFND